MPVKVECTITKQADFSDTQPSGIGASRISRKCAKTTPNGSPSTCTLTKLHKILSTSRKQEASSITSTLGYETAREVVSTAARTQTKNTTSLTKQNAPIAKPRSLTKTSTQTGTP